jgi:hypothetical protein
MALIIHGMQNNWQIPSNNSQVIVKQLSSTLLVIRSYRHSVITTGEACTVRPEIGRRQGYRKIRQLAIKQ